MKLIDKEQLLQSAGYNEEYMSVGLEHIISAPIVDAVSAVRCKDCVHLRLCGGNTVESSYNWCSHFRKYITKVDFCSYGEKKKGD